MKLMIATITTLLGVVTASIFKKYQANENSSVGQPLPEQWANSTVSAIILKWVNDPQMKMIHKMQEAEQRMVEKELYITYGEWRDKMHLDLLKDQDGHPTIFIMQSFQNVNKTGKKAMVHVHGGNGFGGSGLSNQKLFNQVAQSTDTIIFSPRYRLTPNVRAPIPQEDVAASVEYVYKYAELYGVDRNKIVLSGDSAGGNIATGAALLLNQRKKDYLKCLILFQPMINDFLYKKPRKGATKSETEFGHIIEKSFEMLSTDFKNQQDDPMVFPGKMSINQAKQLPSTVLITSEYDIMKRDAYAFKEKLQKAGKLLDFADYMQVGHDSFNKLPLEHPILKQFFSDWVTIMKTFAN